jgi:hypothetical protein
MIRLARARILECKLYADISIAERRNARPPQQPYIACGVASPVEWKMTKQDLKPADLSSLRALGGVLSAKISTGSGGFRTSPCYFVELRGKRLFTDAGSAFVIDGVASVVAAESTSFTIEADVIIQRISGAGGFTMDAATFDSWQVTWMGVEG